ncbi:MAG: ATP synthase F0 sector subunit a [uncultured Gemmatimonadetes bacterium]|uniref:ATP synthase subunit a n=1 Tax=uncultured Gemmatimonadota bacterium TaxID=203437 RepID=A0A6J4MXB0_9BACT|nr:MAG: ATP synthase F0 sector subunit a [uncultured Gemmatimonadota bacterium]
MFARIALVLVLAAGATQAAAQEHAQPAPQAAGQGPVVDPHSANPAEAAHGRAAEVMDPSHAQGGAGHGAEAEHGEEGVDFLHHILDAREIELPGTAIHLPAAGTYKVGEFHLFGMPVPVDLTPTKHLVFLVIAGLLTMLVLLYGGARAGGAERGLARGRRYNMVEAMVLFLRNEVVKPNIGHGYDKYAPFIITLFFFILFNNLLGLLPYGSTATANISVTAGLAILAFVVTEVGGMRALGPRGYLGTIFFVPKGMHPVAAWTMAIALAPVELLGKITKPISLAIRLMANMTAGHIVLLALISLIFVFGSFVLAAAPVLMATAIFFLEIFVGFLQAFIFAMLTSVFIGLMQHAH